MSTVNSQQLSLRKDHLCALPFSGMTIGSRGEVTLCCVSPEYPIKHLKDIPDLASFYNSAEMEHFRTAMEDRKIASLPACSRCWQKQNAGQADFMTDVNTWPSVSVDFDGDWELRKQNRPRPIRYLEYTCSNICNQTCSTCNSFYSSKWRDIEQEQFSEKERQVFFRPVHEIESLNDDDIQKIIEILPHLNQLTIKGGEPWADKNNITILNAALDVNPGCSFTIISNMQAVSASTFRMLEKVRTNDVKKFHLSASIDGIGKVYDWIRGGSFEKTVKNLETYYQVTGRQLTITPCISIHNYFHLEQILDYFADKEYVWGINLFNVAHGPLYVSPLNLPPLIFNRRRDALREIIPECARRIEKAGKVLFHESILNDLRLLRPFSLKDLRMSLQWMEKMNQIRGFRLQDHVPELREITELVS
ncbi:MAG TPA: twitch domain-containing radical SAM protein [Blastocatellia bacterium]|nr:twitch domain-containing radical SAM protein [Blastocatellia bacterium]